MGNGAKKLAGLIIAIAIPEAVGVASSIFTIRAIPTWYATLAKPAFSPPNWVFGPVWTTLYALMGIAAFLVWQQPHTERRRALWLFGIQLVLNGLWSAIFFGLRSPAGALFVIVALWWAILATMVTFSRISKPAALLLLPYLLWVTFATYLNYSIWAVQ